MRAASLRRAYAFVVAAVALAGCGGSSSSSSMIPGQSGTVTVRFAEGAPLLETIIGGQVQSIGNAYLQVNGATVVSSFQYGTITPFTNVRAGTDSLVARNVLGYSVGPIKTPALTGGKRYTIVVVGSYPKYSALAFEEPASTGNAQLSLYEASPSIPRAVFGTFQASSHSDLKQLGTAAFGNLATVELGKQVSNLGGYVATATCAYISSVPPPNCVTPAQINGFDKKNELPFHNATRLSVFFFDPGSGTPTGPVFGSLDK